MHLQIVSKDHFLFNISFFCFYNVKYFVLIQTLQASILIFSVAHPEKKGIETQKQQTWRLKWTSKQSSIKQNHAAKAQYATRDLATFLFLLLPLQNSTKRFRSISFWTALLWPELLLAVARPCASRMELNFQEKQSTKMKIE